MTTIGFPGVETGGGAPMLVARWLGGLGWGGNEGRGVIIAVGGDGDVGGRYMLRNHVTLCRKRGMRRAGGHWWAGPSSKSPCWFRRGWQRRGRRSWRAHYFGVVRRIHFRGVDTHICVSIGYAVGRRRPDLHPIILLVPFLPPRTPTAFSLSHSPKISSAILRLLSPFPSSSYSWWTLGPSYGGWVVAAPGVESIVIAAGNNFRGVCPWMGEGMLSRMKLEGLCAGGWGQTMHCMCHLGPPDTFQVPD